MHVGIYCRKMMQGDLHGGASGLRVAWVNRSSEHFAAGSCFFLFSASTGFRIPIPIHSLGQAAWREITAGMEDRSKS
jgi:hypothetical protein